MTTGSTLRRRLLGTLALAAAGLAWPVYRWKTQRPDIQQWASPLGDRLKESRAGLHTRVSTLAELPRLAAAVATDAATVADLTQDELAFRPHPGETIAIGQIGKRSGKPAAVLLLTPSHATLPSFEQRGARVHEKRSFQTKCLLRGELGLVASSNLLQGCSCRFQ